MQRTPVYIVSSPRPRVGRTIAARLLTEFQLHHRGAVQAFDINMSEPSLVDFLPRLTETMDISDTPGEIALMDRLVTDDGIPKVLDLGYPAFDRFFRLIEDIGFVKEAEMRGIEPIILFMASTDRSAPRAFLDLRARFPRTAIVPVDNEGITLGDAPAEFSGANPIRIKALPTFLRSILDRTNFSLVEYLRKADDQTTEMHQWTRNAFVQFRDLDLNLLLHKLRGQLR
jgi:hypothetical protein